MKKIFYIVIFVLSLSCLQGKPISSNLAKQAAVNFLNQSNIKSVDINQLLDNQSLQLYDAKAGFYNDTIYYVFKNPSGGWIIMSGDDRIEPVIGYSVESPFDKNDLPPSFISWMSNVEESIENIIIKSDDSDNNNNKYYNLIKNINAEELQSTLPNIEPLVKSKWNQGYPYNDLCPVDTHYNEKTVTGCVATAMAQLLYYHGFPIKGKGSRKYTLAEFGVLESDFSKSEYKYSLMKNLQQDYKDDVSRLAVAKLMLDCGISVRMKYGIFASSASAGAALFAFEENFGFKYELRSLDMNEDSVWKNLLYKNLSLGLPMYYEGYSPKLGYGHAFICDGYENEKFHFNWGWGGSSDGYYNISYSNSTHQFSTHQRIAAYIIPKDMTLGHAPLIPDKFEQNNSEDNATIIPNQFEDDRISFYHLLNLHDTIDVDYFVLDLPEDDNHYIFDLNYSDSYYVNDGALQNAAMLRVIVTQSDKSDTLTRPQVIKIEKGGKVFIRIEALYKIKYGNYIVNFSFYRDNKPFVKIKNSNSDVYYSNVTIPVKWISNMLPQFDIELINPSITDGNFGKIQNILDYEYNWKLNGSLNPTTNYMFKVSNHLDPTVFGISEPFEIKKLEYLYIEDPHWAIDVHVGIPHEIRWLKNFNENVTIELFRYGAFYQYIATNVVNSGVYNWLINDSVSTGEGYQVKISKFDDDRIFALSEDFAIQEFTSVLDNKFEYSINLISPNQSLITINLKNQFPDRLILLDILGRKLAEIPNNSEQIFQWNLPDLPKGVYFIQEIKGNEVVTHKIIR